MYADVNILGRSVYTTTESTDCVVVTSKDIRIEVNVDKTKYMVIPRDQKAGRSHSMKTDNSSFQRVEQFKYLGTNLNQNSIQEEIKSRSKSWNACDHSVQNLLLFRLLSENMKIKIYRSLILPVALYGRDTWSLTLREESRLRVFENMILRRIFGPKRDEVIGEWKKNCVVRRLMTVLVTRFYPDDQIEKNEIGRACSTYKEEERCMQGFCGETCGKKTT